jgi:voltage-gated potassium channel
MSESKIIYWLRCWLGIAGVNEQESHKVRKIGKLFEFGLLLIAIWLPIEWYSESHHLLPKLFYQLTNWVIWFAFVAETVVLTLLVERKMFYLTTNWVNLAIIILLFPVYWPHLYLTTIVRVIRICLMFRFLVPWLSFSREFLARNHLGTTLLVAFVLTTASGLTVAAFDPGIPNAFAGVWWAWQTITTVGYGDSVPTSILGRTVAILIMVFGIGLLAVLTANFSAFFLARNEKTSERTVTLKHVEQMLERLEAKIDMLEQQLKNKQ